MGEGSILGRRNSVVKGTEVKKQGWWVTHLFC